MPEQLDEVHLGTRWNYHREELAKLSTTFHMKYGHLCIISGKSRLFLHNDIICIFLRLKSVHNGGDKNSHEKRWYFSSQTHTKARGSLSSPLCWPKGKFILSAHNFSFFATFVKTANRKILFNQFFRRSQRKFSSSLVVDLLSFSPTYTTKHTESIQCFWRTCVIWSHVYATVCGCLDHQHARF